MLTPYDEFPVHQSPHPFSEVPTTDFNWDDGYFWGVFDAASGLQVVTGMRFSPNSDMVGGYASVTRDGVQRTARVSRILRPDYSIACGPLRYEFLTPFRDINLVLEPNESGIAFDLHWLGVAPPHLEQHHLATRRGRRTTDQSRYAQVGQAAGWVEVDGHRYEIERASSHATRDHSWGLYQPRAPLSDPRQWLPPREVPNPRRAFRLWVLFGSQDRSGFYEMHETPDGRQVALNDVFGTPFNGALDRNWPSEQRLRFVSGSHHLEIDPGTRRFRRGAVSLTDEDGGNWRQEFEVLAPPWSTVPVGYYIGSWKDGGNIQTYHGSSPYLEWDEFDFQAPHDHTRYDGKVIRSLTGVEHFARIRMTGPEVEFDALGQFELHIEGGYAPYGIP
jgi:hypothetical protein